MVIKRREMEFFFSRRRRLDVVFLKEKGSDIKSFRQSLYKSLVIPILEFLTEKETETMKSCVISRLEECE